MSLPSQAYLNECLIYYPITGALVWRHRPLEHFNGDTRTWKVWNSTWADTEAMSTIGSHGYMQGTLNSVVYLTHRVIFKMLYDLEPERIDHVDGNTLRNAALNLRASTATLNNKNASMRSHNKSGITGVHWQKDIGKWRIKLGSKHIGTADTLGEAKALRDRALLIDGTYSNRHGQ